MNLQHNLFKTFISVPFVPKIIGCEGKENIDFCGIKIKSRLGLAAGFDRNCEMINSLTKLGFGYVVGGTITFHYREGNKQKPNVIKNNNVIYNSLGLPNSGITGWYNKIPNYVSIWGETNKEFVYLLSFIQEQKESKIIELNLSCPNIKHSWTYSDIYKCINYIKKKPIFIKISPEKSSLISWVNDAKQYCIDGITIGNSIPTLYNNRNFGKTGYFENTLLCVQKIRDYGYKGTVNACGGVFYKWQFDKLIDAGADTVQVLSGFIFRGTKLVKEINNISG